MGRTCSIAALLALIATGCSCAAPSARRDAGLIDATPAIDAASIDANRIDANRIDAHVIDAATPDAARVDAATHDAAVVDAGDAGCSPGSTRPCTVMCMSGGTAPGVERCLGGDLWTACERPTELCGNGLDDDGDGATDEDCRAEGACIWIRPACQGVMTMNEWCAAAGGRHLVAGRRCPVAGGDQVMLDAAYGEYPLCCCDTVSMCVPVCEDTSCASCVVWDEIECCM